MNTDAKKRSGKGIYFLPLLMALPMIAAMIAATVFLWPEIHKLLSILIKLAVRA